MTNQFYRVFTGSACLLVLSPFFLPAAALAATFKLEDASVRSINDAFSSGALSSESLTQLYLNRIDAYEGQLNNFAYINPNALEEARSLDIERQTFGPRSPLHGIPVLLKDNIDTFDMPTTAGSLALEGSTPSDDAFITTLLRESGAVILGKASLTEYANFLANGMPAGYSSLNGYTFNPYNPFPLPEGDGRPVLSPGGSSAGSAAAVAANLVPLSIGTETSGSILSPGNQNSIVGIKPTVGLISRDGIIPIAASQDTAGPFGKTVEDVAYLLGALTGVDPSDPATAASEGLFFEDYTQFLDKTALKGARIGIPKEFFWEGLSEEQIGIAEEALATMQSLGAELVFEEIETVDELSNFSSSVLSYEFKRDLNAYLASLGPDAPVKTLADVIAFNEANAEVALKYGQARALAAEEKDLAPGSEDTLQYLADRATDLLLAKEQGIDAYIDTYDLDAVLFPATRGASIGAKAGYPSIIVPGGYLSDGTPYGITFLTKAYEEPTLISFGYAYEQASQKRVSPSLFPALPGETIDYEKVPEPGFIPALVGIGTVLIATRRLRRKQLGYAVCNETVSASDA
ncbi:amidase family protein [Pseudanabaena sp. FACHB-2040]|uniref:amidase family protein n=1 Tax=Pseudanabaena sp. FACHB-2040 TaxID=2692859 RepID=UPI001689DD0C|nr:amidase family protein [Pseudanabaena sp. FACHB-2040]MBD2259129.1 amidase [Pseudanabaena sp. FACHB-2040]